MAVPVIADNDLINFDIIETHKENIQSLPGGRSAKQLAAILTPRPSGKPGLQSEPTLSETKTLNNAIRHEYEIELQSIADADDPLDIYDRYVKWTLNSYPSAQATPESQLLPLLERATKAFLTSSLYKNDPRYLKLWLHYIRLFSDSPRETFAFLARHGIGDALGLFYEEFAAWLEGAGRWIQADEVFRLGIEKEARPTERLIRKYNQFQQRFGARPQADNEPSSPALPTVRPALAAKIDPFASSHRSEDGQASQQQQQQNGAGGRPTTSRSGKPKMAIFSDADNAAPPPAATTTNGWDNIGSIKERKKENTIEARPWTGEKMKAGGRAGIAPKMEIFKDPSLQATNDTRQSAQRPGDVVNPRTGRIERVFVNIEAIYPSSDQEFSFEELRATSRGWFRRDWRQPEEPSERPPFKALSGNETSPRKPRSKTSKALEQEDIENLSESFQQKVDLNDTSQVNLSVHDVSTQSMVGMPESQSLSQSQSQGQKPREKKYKVREVKQETQTVKTRLQSPTGKKLKRKNTAEPTMTFHSKAATNEIYDMFNQPLRKPEIAKDDTQSGDETEFTEDMDDGYSTTGDAESTGTGRGFGADSEYGEDTLASQFDHTESQSQTQGHSQPDSFSPWSDFTASKHVPRIDSRNTSSTKPNSSSNKAHGKMKSKNKHRHAMADDVTESLDSSSQNATQTSGLGGGFDTQSIAAIANCNFDDMDTKAIAVMAGDVDDEDQDDLEIQGHPLTSSLFGTEGAVEDEGLVAQPQQQETMDEDDSNNRDSLSTPVDDVFMEHHEISHKPRFIPLPPEDYEPTPVRPYRDPALVAQNKLPFMTPIVERTESSLAPSTVFNDPDYFTSKTPSRSNHAYESPSQVQIDKLLMSSPQQQDATPPSSAKRKYEHTGITEEEVASSSPRQRKGPGRVRPNSNGHIPFPIAKASPAPIKDEEPVFKTPAVPVKSPVKSVVQPTVRHKGPMVADLQCNPCDDVIREQILTAVHPPVSSYSGYHDHSSQVLGQYTVLKSYAEKISKSKARGSPRKSQGSKDAAIKAMPPLLKFAGASRVYAVKRELGAGAFAPVYLVESYDPNDNALAIVDDVEDKEKPSPKKPTDSARQAFEALKTEAPPGTLVWEFHILRTIRQRLGPAARTMQSIVLAQECHLFSDEAYIVLEYSPQGTLLDLVNLARNENVKAGKPAEGLEEVLAMWFGVELLRSLEDLHQVGILHGDLKGDNCLVRFTGTDVTGPYDPLGGSGWNDKGLKLIDFGRGIDTKMFKADAQFIADWPSCATDCAEIRECKPWKWQIDYHGAAGVIHSLLFGKYIETVPVGGGLGPGQKKEWKLKENLKRYWEKEIWTEVFGVLLNPATVQDGEEMPVQRNLKRVRMRMEKWLSDEGERSGRDLRGALRKMERLVAGNKSA